MPGKRKRPTQEESEPSDSSSSLTACSLPLTRSNLTTLGKQTHQTDRQSLQSFPAPFDDMAYQTPSNGSASKATTNLTQLELALETWRIYLDRGLPMPAALTELIGQLTVPRLIETTPNSKAVKSAKSIRQAWNEATELAVLASKLVYRGHRYEGDGGEAMILEMVDQQWLDRIPRPPDAEHDFALRNALKNLGPLPKPKPDLYYGYNDDAFPELDLLHAVKALPAELLTHLDKPWFPYMTVQWKSGQGTVRKGEEQARRDTSAAIDCMYRFFKYRDKSSEPSPADTCIFSLIVHEKYFEYRVHWRRVSDDGKVSYEGDIIAQAFFNQERQIFDARTAILETLSWARGNRLTAIRNKLRVLAKVPVRDPTGTPQLNTPSSKPFPANVSGHDSAPPNSPKFDTPPSKSLPPSTPKQYNDVEPKSSLPNTLCGHPPGGGLGQGTPQHQTPSHTPPSPSPKQYKRVRRSYDDQEVSKNRPTGDSYIQQE
ncbi:MAG: hypothetical protein Q9225_006572 [Loekoesia sp. 1 TL-2023]